MSPPFSLSLSDILDTAKDSKVEQLMDTNDDVSFGDETAVAEPLDKPVAEGFCIECEGICKYDSLYEFL